MGDEDKRILRITGETKLEEGDLHLSRKFDQTFTLARDVDMTKATAQFKDNVLTVTVPKVESKVRNLAIDVVESPPAIEQAAESGTTHETQENQEAAQNENANEKSLTVETDEPSSVESPPAIEQAADSETQENREAAQNENANEKSLTVETDEPSSESVIDLDTAKE